METKFTDTQSGLSLDNCIFPTLLREKMAHIIIYIFKVYKMMIDIHIHVEWLPRSRSLTHLSSCLVTLLRVVRMAKIYSQHLSSTQYCTINYRHQAERRSSELLTTKGFYPMTCISPFPPFSLWQSPLYSLLPREIYLHPCKWQVFLLFL